MDDDKYVSGLLGRAISNIVKRISDPDNKSSYTVVVFILSLTALLFLSGSEPLKVLLRKNVGRRALGRFSLVIASLAYIGWAIFLLSMLSDGLKLIGFQKSFILPSAVFYILFAYGVLSIGIREYLKNSDDSYRGDSIFFESLLQKGTSKNKVWAVIEPLTCLALSFLLTLLSPFLGLPLLVTSLSFLLNELYYVYLVPQIQKERFAVMQVIHRQTDEQFNQPEPISEVT